MACRLAITKPQIEALLSGGVLQIALFDDEVCEIQQEGLRYVLRRDPRLFLPELAERRPVLIHAHFGVEAVYGMELAQRLDVPLVTTFHGFDATLKSADFSSVGLIKYEAGRF